MNGSGIGNVKEWVQPGNAHILSSYQLAKISMLANRI